MQLDLIPFGTTNYLYALRLDNSCIFVDPGRGCAEKALAYLQQHNCILDAIFITHHHNDHIGDAEVLRHKTRCKIFGHSKDVHRLPPLTHPLQGGSHFTCLGTDWEILSIDGHTIGHIAYYTPQRKLLFLGDTIFSLGCGRLFEGTPEQMWRSLERIMALPDDTLLCPAHEYTLDNAKFCLSLPALEQNPKQNQDFQDYIQAMQLKRQQGQPTLPTSLTNQKRFNPFLAVRNADFRRELGLSSLTESQAFAHLRHLKDIF